MGTGLYYKNGIGYLNQEDAELYDWKPVKIYWPRRINGHWYGFGSWVWRRFVGLDGGTYIYGDDFDAVKEL